MRTVAASNAGTEELYWEARGVGRPVLLVAGSPGDGGQFEAVADELAADHIVITYDRRGTSRSARASGWLSTSVAEQADDAAGVLSSVGVAPAVVFGTSNGAAVALELALRHPRRVAGVMLHEMPLLSVLSDPEPVASAIGSLIGGAMRADGPPAALEAFLRFALGDPIVDAWAPELRTRMLSNAEMVFSVELPAFQSYRPEPATLARCSDEEFPDGRYPVLPPPRDDVQANVVEPRRVADTADHGIEEGGVVGFVQPGEVRTEADRRRVDRDHVPVRQALEQHPRDAAGAAAGVEHRLVAAQLEPVEDLARHRLLRSRDAVVRLGVPIAHRQASAVVTGPERSRSRS